MGEEGLLLFPDLRQLAQMALVIGLLMGQVVGDRAVVVPDLLLLSADHLQVSNSGLEPLRAVHHQQHHVLAGGEIHVQADRQLLQR